MGKITLFNTKKEKEIKKIFHVFLCILLTIAILPFTVYAGNHENPEFVNHEEKNTVHIAG